MMKLTKKQANIKRREQQEKEAKQRRLDKQLKHIVKDIPKPKFEEYKPKVVWRPDPCKIPSKNDGVIPATTSQIKLKYEDDMLERERLAQLEIEHKKKCVAPLYNKSGYFFLTEGTNPKDIGRKTTAD